MHCLRLPLLSLLTSSAFWHFIRPIFVLWSLTLRNEVISIQLFLVFGNTRVLNDCSCIFLLTVVLSLSSFFLFLFSVWGIFWFFCVLFALHCRWNTCSTPETMDDVTSDCGRGTPAMRMAKRLGKILAVRVQMLDDTTTLFQIQVFSSN